AERKGQVLAIEAVNEVTCEREQRFRKPENQKRILEAWQAFPAEPGFARVATLDDLAGNGFNLSIPLYVKRQSSYASTGQQTQ
ncbi:N-6 DNA methylase, partial [Pseudomonas aeruginosa]